MVMNSVASERRMTTRCYFALQSQGIQRLSIVKAFSLKAFAEDLVLTGESRQDNRSAHGRWLCLEVSLDGAIDTAQRSASILESSVLPSQDST